MDCQKIGSAKQSGNDLAEDGSKRLETSEAKGKLSLHSVSWNELFGALDALTCFSSFQCSDKTHRAVDIFVKNITEREIDACSELVKIYLGKRTNTPIQENNFEIDDFSELKRVLEKIKKCDTSEPSLFLECSAFLNGLTYRYDRYEVAHQSSDEDSLSDQESEW